MDGVVDFTDVTVVKRANVYFDGKVTSRIIKFADGSHKTLGIMMPGDYEFGTLEAELMEILAGEVAIKLQGEDNWTTYKEGQSFNVEANSKFSIQVKELTDYCCSYIQD
ncbi:MAG: pyrimidine/purine nucleoside phosphorylase [Lentisphaeria bacterium]|nr:pyrimidine/purine nucleoside phosphorylase [Lentisphaeria bacterium]